MCYINKTKKGKRNQDMHDTKEMDKKEMHDTKKEDKSVFTRQLLSMSDSVKICTKITPRPIPRVMTA
jgi:hypothetical protein